MYNAVAINKFTEKELEMGVPMKASWHQDYAHSAYLFVGGLNYRMNEGDIVLVFS